MISFEDADAEAETYLASEVLVIDETSEMPLIPGRYYVDVLDPAGLE